MRINTYHLTAFALLIAACGGTNEAPSRKTSAVNPNATGVPGASGTTPGIVKGPTDVDQMFIPPPSAVNPNQNMTPPSMECGNKVVEATDKYVEACDDGNQMDGDGCAKNCLTTERGFSCAEAGKPCLPIAICGDGTVSGSEQCDDANRNAGDGCSITCKFEPGYKCDVPGMACTKATCGDGKPEGGESCDDGNTIPFDGCSDRCITEPKCLAGTSCTSSCGDGILLGANEKCDDGNAISGDGCSKECQIEPGFTCMQQPNPPCEQVGGACVLRVPAVFRDFTDAHADFGKNAGECQRPVSTGDSTKIPGNILTKGIVNDTLNDKGRPALKSGNQKCDAQSDKASYVGITKLDDWFTKGDGRIEVLGSIVLFDNGAGGFVNRYGDMGEKFQGVEDPVCDNVVNVGGTCSEGNTCHTCSYDLGKADGAKCVDDLNTYDGDPLFFPLDDQPAVPASDLGDAKVPAPYGYCAWPWEKDVPNLLRTAVKHNFYFTTEVKTWFVYDAMTNAKLSFTGDDDVWVFVNGKLALDLGGIHGPESGDVTISAATAATYGLQPNNVYTITVFQAERRMEGSSFRLTLSGFETTPTECKATCGDGVVAFGEECDAGMGNTGGYGKCGADCRLGEFCGDGKVNGPEKCDEGFNPSANCVGCKLRIGAT